MRVGGLFFLLLVMAALLFVPAGTLNYWQAWAFLAVFGALALAITLYLMKKDQKLLERRVYAGPTAEKETSQKIIQSITSIGFMGMLVVPALDHRFHWWPRYLLRTRYVQDMYNEAAPEKRGAKFMGIYRRGKTWWISYTFGGRQRFESTRSTKKRDARQLLDIRKGAAREGRLRLTKSNGPRFDEYSRSFLLTVQHSNTRKR